MMIHEFSMVSEGDQGRTFSFILLVETFLMWLLIIKCDLNLMIHYEVLMYLESSVRCVQIIFILF